MIRRKIISFVAIITICLPQLAFGADKTAQGMISKYFEAYSKKDYEKLVIGSDNSFRDINNKLMSVPTSMYKEEQAKLMQQKIQELQTSEKQKMENGIGFKNPVQNEQGAGQLIDILYPEMQYKILEVRDETDPFVCSQCSKLAFIEVTYKNPKLAPKLQILYIGDKERKIRKAIIQLYLVEYVDKKTKKILGYTIKNYVSTDLKREYF